MPVDKTSISAQDICTQFITPAIQQAGWGLSTQVRKEFSRTASQIAVTGKMVRHGREKWADDLFYDLPNSPISPGRSISLTLPADAETHSVVWNYVLPVVAAAGFLLACATYPTWVGVWANRHASQEFRLRRMLIHVRRANLFIETAPDLRQKNQEQPLTQRDVDHPCRRVFDDARDADQETPPVEALAGALLGEASRIKLTAAGNELEITMGGRKRAAKQVEAKI
ncbi:hypothetical protein Mal4_19700 [Maioricimonas rarisocia]|uniref:Uncharacterized protein n=1 Tax=Maioricimonas rarisocia TaxID=2528026 RepID=A0A517Z5A9_9PLAN|nr:hypothetical protein [Maioricimonas rarisocia]QDU37655.1 hypothetical protein Mal4_19700 [Maioricimonas rarisocia]